MRILRLTEREFFLLEQAVHTAIVYHQGNPPEEEGTEEDVRRLCDHRHLATNLMKTFSILEKAGIEKKRKKK